MLIRSMPSLKRQQGVVLMIALIMLVAMTLGGIALIRSVYTSNLIAGNTAFQQSATHSADAGIEAAVTWLETNNTGTTLHNDDFANGYVASRQNQPGTPRWDQFWEARLKAGQVRTLAAADAAGNTVAYTIERLCQQAGAPAAGSGCEIAPTTTGAAGNSRGAGVVQIQFNGQVYYRITARVSGPRSTTSYVQTVVAM